MSSWQHLVPAPIVLGAVLLLPLEAPAPEPTSFPQEAKDRFALGQELRKKSQFQDAIAAFEEAIKLGMQNYPRVHLYRADALRDLKEYDSAIGQYTDFINKFGIEESCRY
jgi:tetratricopeptide (TPR) repeat protein